MSNEKEQWLILHYLAIEKINWDCKWLENRNIGVNMAIIYLQEINYMQRKDIKKIQWRFIFDLALIKLNIIFNSFIEYSL